jgi:membrane protein
MQSLQNRVLACYAFVRYLSDHFRRDCQGTAAALTYQTLFAVVPLMTVTFTVFSSVEAFKGLESEVETMIFSVIVPENVSVISEYIRDFTSQARGLSVVSLAFLGGTAFIMLYTIEVTFNAIWQVSEPRHGFQRFLMYWAILSLGPMLVAFGLLLTSYLNGLVPYMTGVAHSVEALRVLPILLSAGSFTLIYVAVPNCYVPFRYAVSGGILVAVVFEVAKYLFGFVMSQTSFEVIYGAFAAVPLFLLWIYVSWTIVLVGAELVKSLMTYDRRVDDAPESHLYQVLRLLECFYRAHKAGEVVSEQDVVSGVHMDVENWNQYKSKLLDMNLISAVSGGFGLRRNLSEITLWDLYHELPWPLPHEPARGDSAWQSQLSELFHEIAGRNRQLMSLDLESLINESLSGAESPHA